MILYDFCSFKLKIFAFFFFLTVLGFELGASCFTCRCSTTQAPLPALFAPVILEIESCLLAWNHEPPDLIPSSVRNSFKLLGCHERDDTTQKSVGKTKFTSAEWCASDKESGKQAHLVGSPLGFYL
jgi:hypothetical protein